MHIYHIIHLNMHIVGTLWGRVDSVWTWNSSWNPIIKEKNRPKRTLALWHWVTGLLGCLMARETFVFLLCLHVSSLLYPTDFIKRATGEWRNQAFAGFGGSRGIDEWECFPRNTTKKHLSPWYSLLDHWWSKRITKEFIIVPRMMNSKNPYLQYVLLSRVGKAVGNIEIFLSSYPYD